MTDTAASLDHAHSPLRVRDFLFGAPARARPRTGPVRLRAAVPGRAQGEADDDRPDGDGSGDRPRRPARPGARDRRRRRFLNVDTEVLTAISSPSCRANARCSRSCRRRAGRRRCWRACANSRATASASRRTAIVGDSLRLQRLLPLARLRQDRPAQRAAGDDAVAGAAACAARARRWSPKRSRRQAALQEPRWTWASITSRAFISRVRR